VPQFATYDRSKLAIHICRVSDGAAEIIRAIAGEATRDPDLAAAVEHTVHHPQRAAFVELLRRGIARGEVRPEAACRLYADVLPALLTYRMALNNQPVTEYDAVQIVEHAVLPLLAAPRHPHRRSHAMPPVAHPDQVGRDGNDGGNAATSAVTSSGRS